MVVPAILVKFRTRICPLKRGFLEQKSIRRTRKVDGFSCVVVVAQNALPRFSGTSVCEHMRWLLMSIVAFAVILYLGRLLFRLMEQRHAQERTERWRGIVASGEESRMEELARMSPGTRAEFLLNEHGRGDQ